MTMFFGGYLFAAAICDIKRKRIPNALILAGTVVGLMCKWHRAGPPGLFEGIIRFLIIFLISFMLYGIKAIGAGDAKFLCVISIFVGFLSTLKILLTAFLTVTIMYSVYLIGSALSQRIFKKSNKIKNKRKSSQYHRIPFAPVIGISYVIVNLFERLTIG